MKVPKLDKKGNLIIGTTAILIISLFLIAIFVITSLNYMENQNIESKSNDNFKYLVDDYTKNLEYMGRDAINEVTNHVYHGFKSGNSERDIKKELSKILDEKNKEYEKKYDVHIESAPLSVENTDDPIYYLFKVNLKINKGSDYYNGIIENNASVEGLRDPLPCAILGPLYGITYDDKTIYYNNGISKYMLLRNLPSPLSYSGATAPAIIKKCPYDPYIHHGDRNKSTLKDCLKEGYFHESADGSCYLCRLEGKGKCPHYGFEVFIQTHTEKTNESLSCPDHVVFHDHYTGKKIDELDPNSLILDSSHQKKYGLI